MSKSRCRFDKSELRTPFMKNSLFNTLDVEQIIKEKKINDWLEEQGVFVADPRDKQYIDKSNSKLLQSQCFSLKRKTVLECVNENRNLNKSAFSIRDNPLLLKRKIHQLRLIN